MLHFESRRGVSYEPIGTYLPVLGASSTQALKMCRAEQHQQNIKQNVKAFTHLWHADSRHIRELLHAKCCTSKGFFFCPFPLSSAINQRKTQIRFAEHTGLSVLSSAVTSWEPFFLRFPCFSQSQRWQLHLPNRFLVRMCFKTYFLKRRFTSFFIFSKTAYKSMKRCSSNKSFTYRQSSF